MSFRAVTVQCVAFLLQSICITVTVNYLSFLDIINEMGNGLHLYSTLLAYRLLKVLYNTCHTSHIHTLMQCAKQERLGVQCLVQVHLDTLSGGARITRPPEPCCS